MNSEDTLQQKKIKISVLSDTKTKGNFFRARARNIHIVEADTDTDADIEDRCLIFAESAAGS